MTKDKKNKAKQIFKTNTDEVGKKKTKPEDLAHTAEVHAHAQRLVTPVLVEAVGAQVHGDQGDVRVVHGLGGGHGGRHVKAHGEKDGKNQPGAGYQCHYSPKSPRSEDLSETPEPS